MQRVNKCATGFESAVEDAQAPRATSLTFDHLDAELVFCVGSKVKQLDDEVGAVDESLFARQFRVVADDVVARVVDTLAASGERRVGPRQTNSSRRQNGRLHADRRHHRRRRLRC